MPTGTTKIILTGENARAIKAINEVGTASEKAAAKSSSAFDKSTSKVGGLFSKLDSKLGAFGIPLTGALGAMGGKLESSGGKAETLGKKLVHAGDVAATVAAVGIAAVGAAAIHAALEGEAAHARLTTAVANTGKSYDDYGGRVESLNAKMAKLGFENDDVESSLATLTGATKDTGKSIELMGLASDIARGRHISLEEATGILVKVETGRVGALGRLGIATKDATGKTISQEEAIKRLTDLYGGQASAFTDTYAGKLAALQATVKNLEEEMGQKLLPVVAGVVDAFLTGLDTFSQVNAATDGVAGKMLLLTGGALAAAYAGAKVVTAYSATVELFGTVAAKLGLKTVAEEADAVATGEAAIANAANATAIEAEGAAAATTAGELGTLGASAGAGGVGLGIIGAAGTAAAVGVAALGEAYGGAKLEQNARSSGNLATGALALANSMSSAVPGVRVVTSALGFFGVGADKSKKSTDDLTKSTDELKAAEADYAALLKSGTASSDELAAAKHRVAEAAGHVSTEQGKQKAIQDSLTAAEQEGTGATNDTTDATKAHADALKVVADAMKKAEDNLKSYTDAVTSSKDAEIGRRTSVLDVSDALDTYSDKAKTAADWGYKNQKANREWERASLDVKGKINDVATAAAAAADKEATLHGHTLSAADSAGVQRNALIKMRDTIAPNSPFRAYLDGLIGQLDNAAHHRTGSIEIQVKTKVIPTPGGGGVVVHFDDGHTEVHRYTVQPRQHGGPVALRNMYLVGEKGPELFVPKQSGTIIPNGAGSTGSPIGAGVTNINIYAQGIGDRELGRQVVQALREYQRTKGPINLKIAG